MVVDVTQKGVYSTYTRGALSLFITIRCNPLISAANLSIQFGAKRLFENVSVTFGNGNRYGLIGANGCGKSTLMKILAGELEPGFGNVSVDPNARIGQLSQDQFAYEEYRVLDTVIMGYQRLWEVMQERDRLYSLPQMSDEDGMLVADLDYGKLHVYPGNYDEYMTAATQARERMYANNAKKKVKMVELQAFVSRFSANASKARQATSRARQLEKIELEDIKQSSRVSPYIRFEQDKPLRRIAVEATGISKGFDEGSLFENLDLTIEAGSRVAILGQNGIGKTTLARTLLQEIAADDAA